MEFKFNSNIVTMVIIGIILAVTVQSSIIREYDDEDLDNYYKGVYVYSYTNACSSVGGLCVHTADCLEPTSTKGLCADNGAECCYQVMEKEAPCRQFGGECMKNCSASTRQPMGNDCFGDETCCILV